MTRRTIPVAGPDISDHEVARVTNAARDGWYEHAGDELALFERSFADYIGVRHAIATPSCTSAIHLALACLGIGEGDEVIVPDVTWIASAAPIAYVNATPVFADIDPRTWTLDPDSVIDNITERTRCIIAVDLYGSMVDYPRLQKIADDRGIAIIEDAAEAFGSRLDDRRAGAFGDVGVFSFHGSKTLTTGEGGMLVTNRQDIHEQACILRDHGRKPGDIMFRNEQIGFKYRMSGLQAALGNAQLERADELVGKKRQIFDWYAGRLGNHPNLSLNTEPAGVFNSYWMTTIVVDPDLGIQKEQLVRELDASGIACRPMFYPLSSLEAFSEYPTVRPAAANNRNSYSVSPYGLNLPSHLRMSKADVDYVVNALESVLKQSS